MVSDLRSPLSVWSGALVYQSAFYKHSLLLLMHSYLVIKTFIYNSVVFYCLICPINQWAFPN